MTEAEPTATPLPPGIKFEADAVLYFLILITIDVWLGNYFTCFLRPDISFDVQQLNQFIQSPRQLIGTLPCIWLATLFGTVFHISNSLQLSVFSDSDWAACLDSRCSITGYCAFLGGALVS
ncbi:UNVERIFIED_CONTAM: hypothetical protein Scaly_2998900 [Sesamum calycinum]|uniref:Uncharacterized protein n=1 Tax=Sesamum calycinum TaxID=2727403 RepID=A0AAW2KGI1_9LAMI